MACETEKITRVVQSIIAIWNQAGIQIRSLPSIRQKVKILVDNFKSIIKSRRKGTALQLNKENNFLVKTTCLFDIVDQRLECHLSPIRKSFLNDQRNGRLQKISNMNEYELNFPNFFNLFYEIIFILFTIVSDMVQSDIDTLTLALATVHQYLTERNLAQKRN